MAKISSWEDFVAMKKANPDVPPQGKDATPYHAPHAKGDGKTKVRVAEKTGLERTHLYRKLKQLGIEMGRARRTS